MNKEQIKDRCFCMGFGYDFKTDLNTKSPTFLEETKVFCGCKNERVKGKVEARNLF